MEVKAAEMSGKKWALLIGIDRYQGAVPALQGAVADVVDVRSLLEHSFGFEPSSILTLVNEQATRAAILEAIRDHLAARARAGDAVVFHFSGHGSYAWDETNRRREGTLVACDSRTTGGQDLPGSEIGMSLRAVQAHDLAVILDCCHAGNLILSRASGRTRSIPPRRPSAMEPAASGRGVSIGWTSAPFVLLAAAGPLEFAHETRTGDDAHRGVFTYAFSEEASIASPGTTYRDLVEKVRERVRTLCAFQHPQVEGALTDRQLFGDRDSVPRPYLLASPGAQDSVRLAGGAVIGVTVNSRYAVYQPGAKLTGEEQPVAEVEVVRVGVAESDARIVSGHAIQPASRAIETAHHHETKRTRVALEGLPDLASLLQIPTHIHPLDGLQHEDGFDIAVSAGENGIRIEVPNFGNITQLAREASREALLQRAERCVLHWAKWINLLRLDNRYVDLQVDLHLADTEAGASPHAFYHDEDIRYSIGNCSGVPLYVSLLAFGDEGTVDVVFPPHAGSRLLSDGEIIRDNLSVQMAADRQSERDILKVFATATPCDLRILQMAAARGGPPRRENPNPLEQMMEQAAYGSRPIVRSVSGAWTTRQVSVEVRRRS